MKKNYKKIKNILATKSIKALCFLMFYLIISFSSSAQAPDWFWAKNFGGKLIEHMSHVETDSQGNIYGLGLFYSDTLIIGTDTLLNKTPSGIFYDIVVAKFDATGNPLWARAIQSEDSDLGYSLNIDNNGNCYVAGGTFGEYLSFGSTTLNNPYSPKTAIFYAKYAPNGNLLWAKMVSGNGYQEAYGIRAITSGGFYISGRFTSPSLVFGSFTLTNHGGGDIFIAKCDDNGNAIWAKSIGGVKDDESFGCAIDNDENLYITGYFLSPTLNFGTTTITNTTGHWATYVAKYNSSGVEQWAKLAATSDDNISGRNIIVDNNNNCYVIGYIFGTFANIGGIILNNAGSRDMYIAKFDQSGNFVFAKSFGGIYSDEITGICIDNNNDIYITGYFASPQISFDGFTLTNNSLPQDMDGFVSKLDSNGTCIWAKQYGNEKNESGGGITLDPNGKLIVSGIYNSNPFTLGTTNLYVQSSQDADMFLAQLDNTVVSVNETSLNAVNFSIYPNPAKDIITIDFCKNFNGQSILNIYNIYGSLIKTETLNQYQQNINIDDLSNGLYLVTIKSKESTQNQKLIIQR